MNPYSEVLFEEYPGQDGNLGIITLNRPNVLNSLNHGMVNAIQAQLDTWSTAEEVKAVIIRGANGRAFCAGGDLREAYDRIVARDPRASDFFRDEYALNRTIFHYPKPYIALLNGITMGGGVGLSIHGSHRIATENLKFAMPETGIGFFPDVGGTYFLPRLPGYIGFYLGLTGVQIAADECMALGLTQEKVSADAIPALIDALAQHPFSTDAKTSVSRIIADFKVDVKPSTLLFDQERIDRCFCAPSMEEIIAELERTTDPICRHAQELMKPKSPTSLKITLKALQEGKRIEFDACLQQEFRLTCHFLQGHDFPEGIRALIIDKDRSPQWQPTRLEEVDDEEVNQYFAPLTKELI